MSSFDFGVQFLDTNKMTYWGKHRDANFWIENASIKWNEVEAPFHTWTAYPAVEVPPSAGCRRCSVFRCHGELDPGQHAPREHQSRPLVFGGCQQKSTLAS
jgi:hypothetical protein